MYAVLRDPPGGASTASLAAGSELGFSMAIEGAHAGNLERSKSYGVGGGADFTIKSMLAPLGIGVSTSLFAASAGADVATAITSPAVSVQRGSDRAFDFGFSFEMALTTSEEPSIAGQPSDLILGGGASLRVNTAVQIGVAGALGNSSTPLCVAGTQTYEWLPEQVTTHAVTVFQVERMIEKLAANPEVDEQYLQNWLTLLANYRAATVSDDVQTVKEGIDALLANLEAKFHSFAEHSRAQGSDDDDANFAISAANWAIDQFNDDDETVGAQLGNGLDTMAELGPEAFPVTHWIPLDVNKDDIVDYANILDQTAERAGATNCGNQAPEVGDPLCEVFDEMRSNLAAVHAKTEGLCAFDGDMGPMETLCASSDSGSDRLPARVLDALDNSSRTITFSGGSAIELSWSAEQKRETSMNVEFEAEASDETSISTSMCVGAGRRLSLHTLAVAAHAVSSPAKAGAPTPEDPEGCRRRLAAEKLNRIHGRRTTTEDEAAAEAEAAERRAEAATQLDAHLRAATAAHATRRRLGFELTANVAKMRSSGMTATFGRAQAKGEGLTRTVTITLMDGEPGDFFVVKIQSDPVYGTPIFTTLGGTSSCPGETATTKVDDQVWIEKIEYHCSDGSFAPSDTCSDLVAGTSATIGVVITNMSPTGGNPVSRGV